MANESELRRELEDAHATIAAQAIQIQRLEQVAERHSGLPLLRELLQLGDVVGATVGQAPYRALLQGIVNAARRLLNADAASILLVDHDSNELVFEASSGGAEVINLRIPTHQGIAGWVVMTGEPMAVADVRRDPRWAKDFAERVGYIPKSLVAVPLIGREDVEGVLELMDKQNATAFSLEDIELLTLFARPAAIGLEQARVVTNIGTVLVRELERLAREADDQELAQSAERALQDASGATDQTLELARLVHNLSRRGDRARQLAFEVLTTIAKHTG